MRIFIDADACPNVIKEILYRAANRTKIPLILISNHALSTPPSPYIKKIQVAMGLDMADEKIIQIVESHDLVITADIPLADAVVNKGGSALNPRGELYTKTNIKERLAIRNLSTDLRSSGIKTGGPASLNKKDIQDFANALDRFLMKHK